MLQASYMVDRMRRIKEGGTDFFEVGLSVLNRVAHVSKCAGTGNLQQFWKAEIILH